MEVMDPATCPGTIIQARNSTATNNNNKHNYHHNDYMNSTAPTVPTLEQFKQIYSSSAADYYRNTGDTQSSTSSAMVLSSSSPSADYTTKSSSIKANNNNSYRSNNISSSVSSPTSTVAVSTAISSRAEARFNFRRSHTCGSLYAKCGCSTPSPFTTLISTDCNKTNSSTVVIGSNCCESTNSANGKANPVRSASEAESGSINNKRSSLSSSSKSTYVHPDCSFVFTDENKNPSKDPSIVRSDRASIITTKNGGTLELRSRQRFSSPNIGNYAIVDVAVHPEVVLKITTPQSNRKLISSLSEDYSYSSTIKRPQLQRSLKGFQTSTDSVRSADQSDDLKRTPSPSLPTVPSGTATPTTSEVDEDDRLNSIGSTVTDTSDDDLYSDRVDDHNNLNCVKSTPSFADQQHQPLENRSLPENSIGFSNYSSNTTFGTISIGNNTVDPAQKFFQESGILGPLGNSSVQLIRKTSKIMQDANVIEHIRKNSKLLRQGGIYKDELEYTRNLLPGLKIEMEKKDQDSKIKQLEDEVMRLRDIIKTRDNEIYKLKREIHKLKSVLQQTTNHMSIGTGDDLMTVVHKSASRRAQFDKIQLPPPLQNSETQTSPFPPASPQILLPAIDYTNMKIPNVTIECNEPNHLHQPLYHQHHYLHHLNSSPTTTTSSVCDANDIEPVIVDANYNCTQLATHTLGGIGCLENNNNNNSDIDTISCNSSNVTNGGSAKVNHHLLLPQHAVVKKQGVSGESSDASSQQSNNAPIPKFKKDFRSKQLIKDAIMDNDFLKNIDSSQVRELVESMYSLDVKKCEYVIREGEAGAHLYVSAEGEFEVMKNGKVLGVMGPGKAFGELAILYNCTRTASIRCVTNARVWVLDRRVFQQIMMRTGMQRIEDNVNFLKSVPLLKNLSNDVLAKIADVLEVEFYPAGAYIIRQGASGDTFFLISQGEVKVTQRLSPNSEEKEIRTLTRGDYFGEQALINEDKRTANIIAMAPGVECLTLDRESFTHLIGDLCELKEKNYGDENRVLAMKFGESTNEIFGANVKQEKQDIELNDLEVVATLGIGGFGRVELVKCYRENRVETYALKCLKKKHILDTRQEEHVFSERTIMLSCNSPFICRLYRTFKDEKYVYMMLEACMGGEVWTILRDRGCFDETTAQFIIGCVLQAFEYLHSRGIIYRDLKPENLMLNERGYVKLVDFGFAKYIGQSSKTWTFCGTPEYVAPEIILNKGHDRAVDCWALGILIHELLNGTPPFTANDPMKTYNIILKGIDMVDFPKHMSRSAVMLIKRLCRDVPAERLGYQKGGIQDIKKHKWFQGFDWDGLANLTLIPPFLRPVSHSLDTAYFDTFPPDMDIPPDVESGWDDDF